MPFHPFMEKIAEVLRQHPEGLSSAQISALTGYRQSTIRQAMTDMRKVGYRIVCRRLFIITENLHEKD